MIAISDFVRMLSIENELIHDQTNGLSQAETLVQPQPSGNCMNWVLGHLLESQISMLKALGGESPIDAQELERYRRESDPIAGEDPGVLPLERLLEGHDQVHAAIITCLNAMTDADFDQEIQQGERKVKRGWRVFFLHFHYTYHVGQLELLRQLAGRTEKII
jgi:uncharacterized damage-inducible protein DinB